MLTALRVDDTMIRFGHLAHDAPAQTQRMILRQGDGGPIAPKVKSTSREQVSASIREIEPGRRYELAVTLSPPWPPRVMRGLVELETGVPELPNMKISVFASITARLTAEPTHFQVPSPAPEGAVFTARLVWTGKKPGKALSVKITEPELGVELEEKDNAQVITLRVPTGFKPARRSGALITVTTNDPHATELTIPIFWIIGVEK